MKTLPTSRRQFLTKTSRFAVSCCALAACNKIVGASWLLDEEAPDPEKLNYCGYVCPSDCKMLKATLENNIALKEEAYKEWEIEERMGVAFDPEVVYCYGCKEDDKPTGIVLENCTIRECCMEREYECCIECRELESCEKELWQRYPDFHKYVIDLQVKYQASR